MSSEEIVQFFQDCIKNADKLQNGKQLIEGAIAKVPNFCSITCNIITNPQIDSQFRRLVAFIMKNILKDNWMTNPTVINEQASIKDALIAGLAQNYNDLKIIEVMSLTIAELVLQEGVSGWEFHIQDIVAWMAGTDEPAIISAACEIMCTIFNKTDNRISVICPKLLPVLYQIFTNPDLTEKHREKVLMLLYLAIQTFSFADGTDDNKVKQCFDETYDIWLSLFISALQTSVKSHINIKRYILKILTVIFRDFNHYSMRSITRCIQPVWKFLNSNLPLFIWNVVFGVPLEELDDSLNRIKDGKKSAAVQDSSETGHEFELDEDSDVFNNIEALAVQLVELMATLIQKPTLYILIRFGLFPLINCLSHYMFLSKEQEKQWLEDPNQFIADDEDESNMQSLRNSALKVISSLIEKYKDDATQSIMIVAEKFLTNTKEEASYSFIDTLLSKLNLSETKAASMIDFDAEKLASFIKTSHFDADSIDAPWKKREIGLLLLGEFSEDIIAFHTSKNSNFNLTTLLESLVKDIETGQSQDILKGRTLWCLSRFAEIISVQNKNLFFPLFKISASCLTKQNAYPVRLSAAKAIRHFAHKIEKLFGENLDENTRNTYGLNDTNNLLYLWELIDYTSEDTIHLVMEALLQINRLNPAFIPKTAELIHKKLLEIFKMFHHDMINGGIIKDFISLFTQNSEAFIYIYNGFLPFVLQCLITKEQGGSLNELKKERSTDEDLLANLLDILTQVVKNCTDVNQKAEIVNFIPSLVNLMLKSDDVGLLNHGTICLKTFVLHNSEQIITNNLTPQILKVIEKLLQPTTIESGSLFVGNLIVITFAKLLNNSVDADILKAVVSKVYKSKTPSVVQSLILVYARLININEKEMINFLTSFNLEGRPGLKVLIDKWLLHQPLFRGRLTKLSTFYALTKLFLAKDNRVETLLVIGFDPSHTNVNSDVYAPFKILSIMIRCLHNELNEQTKQPNEEYYKSLQNKYANYGGYDDSGARLGTVDDDDDFDMDQDDMMDDDEGDKVQVDIDIYKDEEEEIDIEKRFAMGDRKGKGLADIETGSEFYMSEMLDFEYDDGEEADETTEEDLIFLKDVVASMDLVEMLKNFFTHLVQNDKDYFLVCLKHLLSKDMDLLKKYTNIKI